MPFPGCRLIVAVLVSLHLSCPAARGMGSGAIAGACSHPLFDDGPEYGVGVEPRWMVGADLDGDLDTDLVAANVGSHDLSVLLNNGDGTFAPDVTYGVGDFPGLVAAA
ncbi:MAG: FG-GAP-like repeat-containing protein, partial [Planctomycetota bacterium]